MKEKTWNADSCRKKKKGNNQPPDPLNQKKIPNPETQPPHTSVSNNPLKQETTGEDEKLPDTVAGS